MDTHPAPDSVSTIAIRLTNWVGDAVMNTPVIGRVRVLFPGARIVVLGRRHVAALFRPHPDVDEVWEIDDSSRAGFFAAVKRLRALRADLGFVLPNSLKSAAMFALGGVRHRVGYNRDARGWLLTHPVKLRSDDLAVHEVRYYLRLVRAWETERIDPPPMKLIVSDEERSAMAAWLQERGIRPDDFVVGVNPAALYGTAKRWLPDRYAEVAAHFIKTRGARAIVTGLPAERDVAEEVCRAGGEGFCNAAGEMSLRELMAFLERCNLYLTNDSGAMHIAAAFGNPLVAIFGSTDWVTTAPFSDRARIVRIDTPCAPCILRHCPIDHRCMTGVTADIVIDAAEEVLDGTDRTNGTNGSPAILTLPDLS